jgi:hypothetical protein
MKYSLTKKDIFSRGRRIREAAFEGERLPFSAGLVTYHSQDACVQQKAGNRQKTNPDTARA